MYATTIIETSFPGAYERIVKFILNSPLEIEFGGGTERKKALDSQVQIVLTRPAVEEVLNKVFHPNDPFCSINTINAYIKEYTKEFDASTFDYTYYDLLVNGYSKVITKNKLKYAQWLPNSIRKHFNYFEQQPINQLDSLREGLQKQIDEDLPSNRNIAVLYNPSIGHSNNSKLATPCLNEILVRYEGIGRVSTHTLFRSHDMSMAWEANKIAITKMLYDNVIKPCGCEIYSDIEHNFSGHIYVNDVEAISKILPVQRKPGVVSTQQYLINKISRSG